ncbi:MAG: aminotransferase [Marinilabiliales bacterium]|nr:MAG: aminotransferase [Marinilabiliales bacterium]
MKPSTRISQVSEYYFSKKLSEVRDLQRNGHDIINLGIGSPDLPSHSDVIKELNKTSQEKGINSYQPYRGIDELREAFSGWYQNIFKVNLNPKNEILPLFGSKEGIMHITTAFCNPGDRVLIPNPCYPAYTSVSKLLNLDIQYYNLTEENNWLPNFNELEKLWNNQCKILWINYPHMPTGKVADHKTFKKLVSWTKYRNVLLVNDNPYSLILNDHPKSILSFLNDYKDIIELNSLSKSHNMAGWRVGSLCGTAENINHVLKVKSNFDSGMFKPVQLAASKALKLDKSWYNNLNIEYRKRREIIWKILDLFHSEYKKDTAGLFVWAKIPTNFKSSQEFSDYLLTEVRIFAAPGHVFGSNGKNHVRFSLCANVDKLNQAYNRVKPLNEKMK